MPGPFVIRAEGDNMRKPISSMIVGVAVAIAATVSSGVVSAQNLGGASNNKWWPEMLDLRPLRQQSVTSDPMGPDFNYIERFNKLDLNAVKKDIEKVIKTPQAWWPADYGHYGPFFIRMAWHQSR